MKRKTRVTKKEIQELRIKKKSYNSQKAKQVAKPGPWTAFVPAFKLKAALKPTPSVISTIPDFFGAYQDETNWSEKGWYPVIFNVTVPHLKTLLNQHGPDLLTAALEKSLNETNNLGTIIILKVMNFNVEKEFIGVEAKTNKKHLSGFTAIRAGKYLRLE